MRTLLSVTLLLLLVACTPATQGDQASSTTPAKPKPPPKVVHLGPQDNGFAQTLNQGDTLEISLPANASTGYSWNVLAVDSSILEPCGKGSYAAGGSMPGAPGTATLRFLARGAGTTMLTLGYARPFEAGKAPANVFEVTVTVKGVAESGFPDFPVGVGGCRPNARG